MSHFINGLHNSLNIIFGTTSCFCSHRSRHLWILSSSDDCFLFAPPLKIASALNVSTTIRKLINLSSWTQLNCLQRPSVNRKKKIKTNRFHNIIDDSFWREMTFNGGEKKNNKCTQKRHEFRVWMLLILAPLMCTGSLLRHVVSSRLSNELRVSILLLLWICSVLN